MQKVNWKELKIECPINIESITSLASEIDSLLDYRNAKKPEIIDEAHSRFNVLIRRVLSLFHDKTILKDKDDVKYFVLFEANCARLIRTIDEFSKKYIYDKNTKSLPDKDAYRIYIGQMREILYGDIYDPLKKATAMINEKYKEVQTDENKVSREQFFFYKVYEILSINVGVFGSQSRESDKAKGLGWGVDYPSHAEDMGGGEVREERGVTVQEVASNITEDEKVLANIDSILSKED